MRRLRPSDQPDIGYAAQKKARKPFKVWFRAVFGISTRRTGISAKGLQRILGFGSYETAWTWLLKLSAALVREDREPLGPLVQIDECLVGGKWSLNKELILVVMESNGRVRLARAANNDAATLKRFVDGQIVPGSAVTTDGHVRYNVASLGKRPQEPVFQTKTERAKNDAVQTCHWSISNLKRWLLATHGGAVSGKHLQAYLEGFTFRHNRRRTKGVARIAARVIETLVGHVAPPVRRLLKATRRCRRCPLPELSG